MYMNKKDIETLAVNAVRDSIALCDYMEPYLNDNDKTPSWDGDIYIYTTPDRKKENLRGLIKSQIKGKEQSDLTKNSIHICTFDPIPYYDDRKHLLACGEGYIKQGSCTYL